VRDRLLILPIVGEIDRQRARQLTEQLLHSIRSRRRAQVVVIDITGVPAVDSGVANRLIQTVEAARLMGARTIVTGLSAEVAQTLVDLGVELGKVTTVGDLQGGIEMAERMLGLPQRADRRARPERAPARLTGMSIPILRQGDCLIAFIQPSVSDDEWLELHREMGEQVRAHRAPQRGSWTSAAWTCSTPSPRACCARSARWRAWGARTR